MEGVLRRLSYGLIRAKEFGLSERCVGEDIRVLEVITQEKANNTTTHPEIGLALAPIGLIKVMI